MESAFDAEGWFRTGDIGYFDSEVELFLVDRKKDMIKYKSHQLAPSELEQFIKKQFDVQDIVVVGVPAEEDIGFLPAAVVIKLPNSTITEKDIIKAITGNSNYVIVFKYLRKFVLLFR